MTRVKSSQKKTGPVGKTSERARYIELTREGLNNSEICRMLGIWRKTGSKWRNGYTWRDPKTGKTYQYASILEQTPETRRSAVISARFLSEDERIQIADLLRGGHTVRGIAEKNQPGGIDR